MQNVHREEALADFLFRLISAFGSDVLLVKVFEGGNGQKGAIKVHSRAVAIALAYRLVLQSIKSFQARGQRNER